MPDCTPSASLALILAYVLPPLGALLSAIALWVASRARTTSADALQTSSVLLDSSTRPDGQPERRGSVRAAQALRKSCSTTPDQAATYTSHGDDMSDEADQ